jgi:demethylmenaquinone methyltransferase/2-methoxy-6-polyprenyl-1,4-benzoquinol methylase
VTEIDADALISEQIEYYRARAPWYDDWWYREGQYATGGELENRWHVDVESMLADLDDWLLTLLPAHVLELAGPTAVGWKDGMSRMFTRLYPDRA